MPRGKLAVSLRQRPVYVPQCPVHRWRSHELFRAVAGRYVREQPAAIGQKLTFVEGVCAVPIDQMQVHVVRIRFPRQQQARARTVLRFEVMAREQL